MPCVRFLANFGANLWSLNCEMHTPKELAALNNREEVLRFLDETMAKQEVTNRKEVKAKKEKAQKEAERKLKEYDKVKKKAEKYAEKEQKRLEKEREKMGEEFLNGQNGQQRPSLVLMALKNKTGSITRGNFTPSPKFSEIVGTVTEANAKKFGVSVVQKIQQKYGSHRGGPLGDSDFKVIEVEDGKKSVKNLIGLRRDSEILYVGTYDKDKGQNGVKRGKLSDVFHEKRDEISGKDTINEDDGFGDDILLQEPSSIFDRPGFGNFAFRNSITATLNALPITPENIDKKEIIEEESSIGSAGSLAVRQNTNRHCRSRWSTDILSYEDGIDSLDEEDNENYDDSSPIQLFLISNGLGEYIDRFLVEKIDLESMLMLTEDDLKSMDIPLGPRRKLMAAIENRKKALQEPGQVQDSQL
ncbi:UNVERIFIED_CONTAM: hypothetical protein PYX00_001012 [Menopon gallinae]|uniref:SAM domain-containing protein n=1 Tax=Menopon gallinae TaxID=328185 RepID=A0AAW2ICF5_9NEOP